MSGKFWVFGVLIVIFGIFMSSFGAPAPIVSAGNSTTRSIEIEQVNFEVVALPEAFNKVGYLAKISFDGVIKLVASGFDSEPEGAQVVKKDGQITTVPINWVQNEVGKFVGSLYWHNDFRSIGWTGKFQTLSSEESSPFTGGSVYLGSGTGFASGFTTTQGEEYVRIDGSQSDPLVAMVTPAWGARQILGTGVVRVSCSNSTPGSIPLYEDTFTPLLWETVVEYNWADKLDQNLTKGSGTIYLGTYALDYDEGVTGNGPVGSWVTVFSDVQIPGCGSEVYLPMVVR